LTFESSSRINATKLQHWLFSIHCSSYMTNVMEIREQLTKLHQQKSGLSFRGLGV